MRPALLVPIALTTVLLTSGGAQAAPAPPPEIPAAVTAAARTMKCHIINQIYSSPDEKPTFNGATCQTKQVGYLTVRQYASPAQATTYWLDGVLAGAPTAWIARKGRLFVIPDDVSRPYTEAAARYAAKRIGGKAVHGR